MTDTKGNDSRVSVAWVPVCDSEGRTHMEARWSFGEPQRTQAA